MYPEQNPELIIRQEEDGKYLVFNRENQVPLVLNSTSHTILHLCDGSHDLDEIRDALIRDFDIGDSGVEREQLGDIVRGHIDLMRKLRILNA